MSHHGFRHSRISRIINAKHRNEKEEDTVDGSNPALHNVNEVQKPLVLEDTVEPCDPINRDCMEDLAVFSSLLVKRQADSSQTSATVSTVVQVVESTSQTASQSTGTEFPMTLSGTFDVTISATFSATLSGTLSGTDLLATSPTDSSIASITSPTTQPTTSATSKQRVPVSSPRVSAGAGSQHTSTPLVSSASSPTSSATTSTSTVNSVYYYSYSTSSSISASTSTEFASTSASASSSAFSGTSWTGYYSSSTETPSSTTDVLGAVHTGTSSGSSVGDGSGSSTNSGSSGSGSSISPTTSKIVGGVIGSVAGLALIFALLFYILRRRGYLQRFLKDKGTEALPSSDAGTAGTREMAERPSSVFTTSYLAPAFMKRWRQSTMTTRTDSTVDSFSSERGFQKISGRKIPPVLTHGGDGFGGGLDGDSPTIPDCLIGLSPSSSTGGPSGGLLSSPVTHGPPPASPFGSPLDTNYTREIDEFPTPPRSKIQLPVSSSVNFGSPTMVSSSHSIPQPQSAIPVQLPDSVGRSLPSFDGSRGSRFTESLDL
ncbi:hypothetical protein N7490_004756 [Penicillium lividum]|nr:hypothetical protein N7490_004756 [Penicillium lividum]